MTSEDPSVPTEAAVAALRPRDHLGIPLGPGIPPGLLHALSERDDWVDLTISGALLIDLFEVFTHPGVHHLSGFFGPAERFLVDSGADVAFVPADFRRFATVLEERRPRVMATAATPPDEDGFLSLSLHAGATYAELCAAAADPERVLIVEANPGLPRTVGLEPDHPHRLHVDDIDLLISTDRDPFVLDEVEPTETHRAIAAHVAPYVVDGATLQTGIGAVPSAVLGLLADHDGGGYGIHSEMFTTGLMRLARSGKVTNTRKGIFAGHAVTTFAAGTAELYTWLDDNPEVRFLPASVVNAPEVISANRDMVSINGAMTVDLYGQVVADNRDGVQFSGIGGHEDFIAGSGLELEDRSLVCLPSTAGEGDATVSRIVSRLDAGAVVTTPRHQLDVVVTEHGAAELRGRTVGERARALAAVADPTHRAELEAAAADM